MVTDSWSVAAELTAQYSVLHQFAVGACSRDDATVAKFHRRISVRHVRRGIRCCHYPPWCLCRLRCYLQCLSKGHERVARNGGPCVHAEIAVCQCVTSSAIRPASLPTRVGSSGTVP